MNRIELDNRKKAVSILKGMGWHTMPVENKAHYGTPDLNAAKELILETNLLSQHRLAIEIWIEFKIVEEWPKKAATKIKIKHFSKEQKVWLKTRIKHNPNCFIIVQIEEDHFLYKATTEVINNLGSNWTAQQMNDNCIAVCKDLTGILDSLEKGI